MPVSVNKTCFFLNVGFKKINLIITQKVIKSGYIIYIMTIIKSIKNIILINKPFYTKVIYIAVIMNYVIFGKII